MKKNYTDVGQVIEINLEQFGYRDYYAECFYRNSETVGCMSVMIVYVKKELDGSVSYVAFAGTDQEDGSVLYRQDIHSTKGTIKNDLYRIVSYMCTTDIIKEYINEGDAA